jgi:hypothetical protein
MYVLLTVVSKQLELMGHTAEALGTYRGVLESIKTLHVAHPMTGKLCCTIGTDKQRINTSKYPLITQLRPPNDLLTLTPRRLCCIDCSMS